MLENLHPGFAIATVSTAYLAPPLAADFDQDGRPDLVVGDALYLNANGVGLPTRSETLPVAATGFGDFDGDGSLDLVTSDGGLLFNDGTGHFPASDGFITDAIVSAVATGPGHAPLYITKAASSSSSTRVSAFERVGLRFVRRWSVEVPLVLSGMGTESVVAADLEGDGTMDLALPDTNGLWLIPIGTDGSPGASTFVPVAGGEIWPTVGDFNHDGRADFVFADATASGLSLWASSGWLTFTEQPWVGMARSRSLTSTETGRRILRWFASLARWSRSSWAGRADSRRWAATRFGAASGYAPSTAADFNGDGHPDFLVYTPAGTLLLSGLGDGSLGPGVLTHVAEYSSLALRFVPDDFDGDGAIDVAVGSFFEGVTVYLNDRAGSFRYGGRFSTGPLYHLESVDADGDLRPDLMVGGMSSVVLFNRCVP
ncbi:MAG: VCBS repeat-containing protein [Myxococcales bacterium]